MKKRSSKKSLGDLSLFLGLYSGASDFDTDVEVTVLQPACATNKGLACTILTCEHA